MFEKQKLWHEFASLLMNFNKVAPGANIIVSPRDAHAIAQTLGMQYEGHQYFRACGVQFQVDDAEFNSAATTLDGEPPWLEPCDLAPGVAAYSRSVRDDSGTGAIPPDEAIAPTATVAILYPKTRPSGYYWVVPYDVDETPEPWGWWQGPPGQPGHWKRVGSDEEESEPAYVLCPLEYLGTLPSENPVNSGPDEWDM